MQADQQEAKPNEPRLTNGTGYYRDGCRQARLKTRKYLRYHSQAT